MSGVVSPVVCTGNREVERGREKERERRVRERICTGKREVERGREKNRERRVRERESERERE